MTTSTIKTYEAEEPENGVAGVCGICRRQISRYICPPCNLPYCSLICYRSESHSQCSETFYRKEVEISVNTASKTKEDKAKMLELLQRIEDQSADEVGLFDTSDDGDEEEDSVAHRFSAIEVSSASSDDLLRRLNKKERDEFFAAVRDPSSRLVQELLDSVEFRETRQLPWWEAPNEEDQSPQSLSPSYGTKPNPMTVPTNLIGQASRGISLLYNICVVFLAYSYVTRHLSISPLASSTNDAQDQHEARRILAQSVPFLTDHTSKVSHTSLTDAVTSFWSRLDPASINNEIMAVLLEDVARLIRPQKVVIVGHSFDKRESTAAINHPSNMTVLAISDLSSLFGTSVDSLVGARRNHIVMKLTFYAAHILSVPSSRLYALADEVHKLSMNMGEEARQSQFNRNSISKMVSRGRTGGEKSFSE